MEGGLSLTVELQKKAPQAELRRELEALLDVQLQLAFQFEQILLELKLRRMRLKSVETMIQEVQELICPTT